MVIEEIKEKDVLKNNKLWGILGKHKTKGWVLGQKRFNSKDDCRSYWKALEIAGIDILYGYEDYKPVEV